MSFTTSWDDSTDSEFYDDGPPYLYLDNMPASDWNLPKEPDYSSTNGKPPRYDPHREERIGTKRKATRKKNRKKNKLSRKSKQRNRR